MRQHGNSARVAIDAEAPHGALFKLPKLASALPGTRSLRQIGEYICAASPRIMVSQHNIHRQGAIAHATAHV